MLIKIYKFILILSYKYFAIVHEYWLCAKSPLFSENKIILDWAKQFNIQGVIVLMCDQTLTTNNQINVWYH